MTPVALEAHGISKAFRLPHEVRATLKEHFLHPFKRVEYERNQALANVSFEVERGEFFGITGPNGSGKSTLLKIIAGIYRPDEGSIRIHGKLSPFIELGVGFHPMLNARDNVRVNATLLGLTGRELDDRFGDIIGFAELERFVDQKLKDFSPGMELRLAYSIAIQVPFDILLLDEVLAVGDQEFQEKCYATFQTMQDEGKTIVFVSHDLDAMRRFCDRVMLLEDGRVQAIGPAEDMLERYRTQETATHR